MNILYNWIKWRMKCYCHHTTSGMDSFSSIPLFHHIIIYLQVCNRRFWWMKMIKPNWNFSSSKWIGRPKIHDNHEHITAHTHWKKFESSWRHTPDFKCRSVIIILIHLLSMTTKWKKHSFFLQKNGFASIAIECINNWPDKDRFLEYFSCILTYAMSPL